MTQYTQFYETTLRTKQGSAIRRYRGNVGKQVGSSVYVHKLYADEVIPAAILQKAEAIMTRAKPEFNYNTIMVDAKRKIVRFDEAPDFDTASEPHVGDYVVVSLDGTAPPREGHSDSIWHHKWLWVKDDYTGFDVDKSKEWSRIWLAKLDEPAKGTDLSWQSQLRRVGLNEGFSPTERWVGMVDAYGKVHLPLPQDGERMHDEFGFGNSHNRFSYWPYSQSVSWWVPSTDTDNYVAVEDFLKKKGYPVLRHVNSRGDFVRKPLTEIFSFNPKQEKPEKSDIVYGGIWSTGRIVAKKNVGGHSPDMGWNRWVYNADVKAVFWWNFPPDDESRVDVTNYLERMGYEVKHHKNLDWTKEKPEPKSNMYPTKGGYGVDENKLQIMESKAATPKDLEAFLREQIKGTEWEGKVFLVGGFVRDELLGKPPKDADIVVGKFQGGVEFTEWLGKKLGIFKEKTNPVIYPTFGTANLRLEGVVWNGIDFSAQNVDAVMFRKEQYHDPNSRKPVVQYTPYIEVDASRRDLTFNALYKDVSSGKILDPTGKGMADLKAGLVRTPIDPNVIYTDDALRMFRAVRFATQFNFQIAPEVIEGIKNNLHRLGNTSKERVRDELNKILLSKNPVRGIRLLKDVGLLPHIAAELQQAIGMAQNVHHTHDVFDHTLEVLTNTKPELVQRLMALFHDIGKVATRSETPTGVHFYGHEQAGADIVDRVLRDLKYPTDIINAVKAGVANHMRLKHGGDDAVKLSDKSLRKFKIELGNNLENLLDVIHADNIAHADASAMPNQIEHVRRRLKNLDIQVSKPTLPINGNDLQMMGIPKGPLIGKILSAVTDAWYENPNISKAEATEIALAMRNQ